MAWLSATRLTRRQSRVAGGPLPPQTERREMALTAILDVDGTLVDTNYHHALAWHRALHARGHRVPMWRVHRHIGIGGDKIVAALTSDEVEHSEGDEIRDAEGEAYGELIGEVEPMEGAHELIEEL